MTVTDSYADDTNTVYEVQPTEVDNLLQTNVRLLDLVDLEVTSVTVSFNTAPWITATVRNNGIEAAEFFSVDFYQVSHGPPTALQMCMASRSTVGVSWSMSR